MCWRSCRDDDCGRFCSIPTFHHTTPPFAGLGLRSFLVSDLSESLTSLIKKEGMSKTLIKKYKKRTKNTILQCNQFFLSKSLIYHKRSEQIALLTWATWGIRSFVLSESLTVAHLIWAIWANERIPSPGLLLTVVATPAALMHMAHLHIGPPGWEVIPIFYVLYHFNLKYVSIKNVIIKNRVEWFSFLLILGFLWNLGIFWGLVRQFA